MEVCLSIAVSNCTEWIVSSVVYFMQLAHRRRKGAAMTAPPPHTHTHAYKKNYDSMMASDIELTSLRGEGRGVGHPTLKYVLTSL